MISRLLTCALAIHMVVADAKPLKGQFSSDIPGIPRASVPMFGGGQGRFELDISGLRRSSEQGETTAGRVRVGVGQSWRLGSNWELGFDFSLGEGQWIDRPTADTVASEVDGGILRATTLYGLRVGLKFRPISYVGPDGNGVQAAIGVAYQPQLQPLLTIESMGDSSVTGGLIGDSDDSGDVPEVEVHASAEVLLAVGYRSDRLLVDGGLIIESASAEEGTPLVVYDGVSPRLGLRWKLSEGFGLGLAWWGSGAPPWRDRLALGAGIDEEDQSFGFILSFGAAPEKGTSLMISSPGGDFSESVGLLLQVR